MQTEILAQGLCFPEGPRWRDGRLWCSDMHAGEVVTVDADGTVSSVLEVANDPSGLGWLPNGDLLVVSMTDQRLLAWNGETVRTHANLSKLASFHLNDMVVDGVGRAYVGNFGFDLHAQKKPKPAEVILVEPDGGARVVADDMLFPNGTVITPDGDQLIVAESWGARLTAFDLDAEGSLTNRRVWAALADGGVPDGICLDEADGIWAASPSTNECLRLIEGGKVTHRVSTDQGAFACMLGGTTLHILTCSTSDPDACRKKRSGRIEVVEAPYAGAGHP